MRNFISLFLAVAMIGCAKNKNSDQSFQKNYKFEIADSIRVNQLEEFTLIDSEDGLFLAKKNGEAHYIIFDRTGKITSDIELKSDGPNAINMAYSEGFFDGKFTVMELHRGLIQFSNEGEIVNNIPIPENYIYMHPYNRPAFRLGNKIAYYRPERDMSDWEDQAKFYRKYYQEPLLEVIDPITKEVELKMELPETSVYKDGDFHFLHHPKIIRNGNLWYLLLMAEMKFYVYEEKDGDLILKESVSLDVKDQVPFPEATLGNTDELFRKLDLIVPSMIEQLYVLKDKFVLIYRKGAGENVVQKYDRENQGEWTNFFESLPLFAAVFDSDYKLLQDEIQLPSGILTSPIVDQEGRILVQKNQRLRGEEDWNTYYLLKLSEVLPANKRKLEL